MRNKAVSQPLTLLRCSLFVAGLVLLCTAQGCFFPQRDRFDLTERHVDLNTSYPIGQGYAHAAGILGRFINGHGLLDYHITSVITCTSADGKTTLIWPDLDFGDGQANAVILGDILVFAGGLPGGRPALMVHHQGEPPLVISAAVLRLAAHRLGTATIVPGTDYRFTQVRLPPGRIWLKAAELSADPYSNPKEFTVELTLDDLIKVIDETRTRGKQSKARRFEYIAEAGAPARIEAGDVTGVETVAAQNNTLPKPAKPVRGAPYTPQPERLSGKGLMDPIGHHVYFSTYHQPGRLLKIAPGDGLRKLPAVVGAVVLEPNENNAFYGVIDLPGQCAYLGTDYPGHVVKIALGTGNEPPYRVGSVLLDAGYNVRVGVVDSATGYGCFNVANRLYKLRLGKPDEPPTVVAHIELSKSGMDLVSVVLDPTTHYAYFGSDWVKIYKVALGDGDSPPRLVGELTLPEDEGGLRGALIDPQAGYAWFVSTRGSLVKISLGEKDNPPQRVGSLKLSNRYTSLDHTFGMDGAGYAYLGATPSDGPNRAVLKIALGKNDELPRLASSLVLKPGEDFFATGIVDPVNRVMCLGMGAIDCYLLSLTLGEGDAPPRILGTKPLYP